MKISKIDIWFAFLLVFVCVLGRLLPHPLNFTPVLAIGLFAGKRFGKTWMAFLIPVFGLLLSDVFLGFHSTIFYTYGSVLLISLIGGSQLFTGNWFNKVVLPSLGASLIFFIVTNFGVWRMEGLYPTGIDGLWACYLAGIPFYKNTFLSTAMYYAIILVIEHQLTKKFSADGSISVKL